MWEKARWAGIVVGSALMFMAGVSPDEAASNIAGWASKLGLGSFATNLNSTATDQWGFIVGFTILLLSVISIFVVRRKGETPKPIPQWISLRQALDYLTNDSKFSLPTRNRPAEAFAFWSALALQQEAGGGRLKIKGRKKDSAGYKIIDSDYWRLAQFEHMGLLSGDSNKIIRTELYSSTTAYDSPPVAEFLDLLVEVHELRELFPPKSRWDKSSLGTWFRNKRVYSFRRKGKS